MDPDRTRIVKSEADVEVVDGVVVHRGMLAPGQLGGVAAVAIGAIAAGAVTVAAMRSSQLRAALSVVAQQRR